MMNFHKQDREWIVTLSAAKGLSRWAQRCFPFATLRASAHSLSMTGPTLVVKIHYRGTSISHSFSSCIEAAAAGRGRDKPLLDTTIFYASGDALFAVAT